MAPNSSRVSVIMSVYNGELYLAEAIESVLSQTFTDFEFLITDDGSTDSSFQIIQDYEKRDNRIKAIHHQNIGLTKSLNQMINISNGEFIARQDADDISHPERLAKQMESLLRNDHVMLLGTGGYLIDEKGCILHREAVVSGPERLRKALLRRNLFLHGSVMIRRFCLDKIGAYNEEFMYAQDYELFLRIAEEYPVDNLPEPLYCYRLSSTALSTMKSRNQAMAGLIARTASLDRRGGLLKSWVPGTYSRYEQALDTPHFRRWIDCNISLAKGKNFLIANRIDEARQEFARALRVWPAPRPLYHLLRTFFVR